MKKILLIVGLTIASVLATDYATNHPDETLSECLQKCNDYSNKCPDKPKVCRKDIAQCGRYCREKDSKKIIVAGEMVGVCQKSCGLDFGNCLLTTGDFKTCAKDQANCALDCRKTATGELTVAQSPDLGVCEKNCAIDFTKCLVTTFDMATCSKQEAGCSLDCLKSVESKASLDVRQGLGCTVCTTGVSQIESIINK